MEKIPFTQAGLDRLKEELNMLKNNERQAVIKAIAEAREHGDLSENAEYHAARERQSFIEGRITELEDVTSRAEVVDMSRLTGKTVTFGTQVVIADEVTDEESSYTIVGPYEADIEKNDDFHIITDCSRPNRERQKVILLKCRRHAAHTL